MVKSNFVMSHTLKNSPASCSILFFGRACHRVYLDCDFFRPSSTLCFVSCLLFPSSLVPPIPSLRLSSLWINTTRDLYIYPVLISTSDHGLLILYVTSSMARHFRFFFKMDDHKSTVSSSKQYPFSNHLAHQQINYAEYTHPKQWHQNAPRWPWTLENTQRQDS
jgi:hypothetical protein